GTAPQSCALRRLLSGVRAGSLGRRLPRGRILPRGRVLLRILRRVLLSRRPWGRETAIVPSSTRRILLRVGNARLWAVRARSARRTRRIRRAGLTVGTRLARVTLRPRLVRVTLRAGRPRLPLLPRLTWRALLPGLTWHALLAVGTRLDTARRRSGLGTA